MELQLNASCPFRFAYLPITVARYYSLLVAYEMSCVGARQTTCVATLALVPHQSQHQIGK